MYIDATQRLARLRSEPGRISFPGVRLDLVLLATLCVAIALALAGAVVLNQAADERAVVEQQAQSLARTSATAVDREIAAAKALLTGLAVSHNLETGDFAGFHRQASDVEKPPGSWITLFDREGRQLVNTLRPYGAWLPSIPASTQRAIVEGSAGMAVSNLDFSPLINGFSVSVAISVIGNGGAAYFLSISLPPEMMATIFERHHPPQEWSAAILDRSGATIAAFPVGGEQIGGADHAALLDRIAKAGNENFETTLKQRGSVFLAHSRSAASGWTVIASVPRDILTAPMRRASILLAGGGGSVLVVGAGLAFLAGFRIDRPYRRQIAAGEQRFRVLADTVPSILFTTGCDGRCEYVNQRFCDYTGLRMEAALGFGWIAAIHPDDRGRLLQALMRPPDGDDIRLSEVRLRHKEGAFRWFLGRYRPLRDAGSRTAKWFGSATDIDDFKTAEVASRRANERLTAVLSSIDECFCTVNRQFRLTYMNANAAAWHDRDPDRVLGRTLWELMPTLAGTDLAAHLRKALDEQVPHRFEAPSIVRPGHWVEFHCYPWADGMGVFYHDISRRKAAEHALQGTQELLQGTMDALSAQVAVLDSSGVIIAVNAAWRRFAKEHGVPGLGYEIGSNYIATCAAAGSTDAEKMANGLRSMMRGEPKEQEFRIEYCCRTAAGSRWFQGRANRFGENGALRVVVALEDITEVKNAEGDLRELTGRLLHVQDEERRRLARELHDTTAQNLVAALLNLDRFRQKAGGFDATAEAIADEARAFLDQSLQEIRTFSYLLHPPLLEELGLASALRWYIRGFETRSGITVSLDVEEVAAQLPPAVAGALFRVVQEALTNVHRHSGSATAVVRLAQRSRRIVLKIADQGRGMGSPSGEYPPLGVGISGMRARLHQLGGTLDVCSTAQGTAVTATLPVDVL